MIKLTRKYQFPKYLRKFKQLKGICIGGCVDKKRYISTKHWAHTHQSDDRYGGWICLRGRYQLKMKLVMLHEMAHLLVSPRAAPHGRKWKRALLRIGGTFKSFVYRANGKIYTNLDYTYRSRKQ